MYSLPGKAILTVAKTKQLLTVSIAHRNNTDKHHSKNELEHFCLLKKPDRALITTPPTG